MNIQYSLGQLELSVTWISSLIEHCQLRNGSEMGGRGVDIELAVWEGNDEVT